MAAKTNRRPVSRINASTPQMLEVVAEAEFVWWADRLNWYIESNGRKVVVVSFDI